MAGEAKREIKSRMRSIEGTQKITKAMGLVASSKILKARERVERSRPYFQIVHETLIDIACANTDFSSPYLTENKVESKTIGLVVIGGDRGLAGGYNNNLFSKVKEISKGKNMKILPVGKKVVEYYRGKESEILSTQYEIVSELTIGMCFEISFSLCKAFLQREFDEVLLVYTKFTSMLEQTPAVVELLPLYRQDCEKGKGYRESLIYEPSSEAVYDAIVPEYVAALIYGALCESQASEHAARHTAMDAASKNAEEMLDDLLLIYNKARQGAITQEISEIVAGSEE